MGEGALAPNLPSPLQGTCAPEDGGVEWVCAICKAAATDEYGHLRAGLFVCLSHADWIMRRHGKHLSTASAVDLARTFEDALALYSALASKCAEQGLCRWAVTPRHHALTHIGFDNGGTNPRQVHCYSDEDMVGKMKRIFLRCHGATAGQRGLRRYRLLQAVRWKALSRQRGWPIAKVLPTPRAKPSAAAARASARAKRQATRASARYVCAAKYSEGGRGK